MKVISHSLPFGEGTEAMGFIICGHACADERSCLMDVDGVSWFMTEALQRFPPLVELLVQCGTTSVY